MNGKQLKNSILQWAIQGKLVPQDPNDEPASVLLEKIRQEKERLIKEKKIKRDKNASIIYRGEDNSYYEKILATGEVKCIDEEIPFEIPQGWEWTRIGNIFNHTSGKQQSSSNKSGGTPQKFITTSNLYWGYFLLNNVKVMNFTEEEIKTCSATKGDLLVCEGGAGYGRSAIWNEDYDICLQNHVHRLRPLVDGTCEYVYYFIYLQKESNSLASVGTAMPGLSANRLKSLLIPLPPIAEQKRITNILSEVFPKVEKYELTQEKQNLLNSSLNGAIKKSILQEAIQGKLVPQIESEDTVKELLEQIQTEKQRLVKEGKLKKSALTDSVIYKGDDNKYYEQIGKQCKEITEEIPFDLPDSWSWTRGKTVFMPMESTKPITDFTYIDVDAVDNKLNIIDNPKRISIDKAPSRATRKLHSNDILFSMVRPYLRNIALVNDTYKSAIASTGFYVITPGIGYFPKFLFYLMLSNYVIDGLNTFMKGDNSPSINNGHIENYLYPLPPIKEQQRIVAQIERLFEQLK